MRHSEADIIRALETENRMMERQQLLKELWKLNRDEDSVAEPAMQGASGKRSVAQDEAAGHTALSVSGQAI